MTRKGTLPILGHHVKYQRQLRDSVATTQASFCTIAFKFHLQVVDDEERSYSFWVMGSNVVVNFGPLRGIPRFALSSYFNMVPRKTFTEENVQPNYVTATMYRAII